MRHSTEFPIDQWICPSTGKPFDSAWSEEKTFDSCNSCRPENSKPVGQRLHELEEDRAAQPAPFYTR
jgi:hypothetical protein